MLRPKKCSWLTTQVLVPVLEFRRAVSSCLETDTQAGDSTLSKTRGRGLEGRVAFGVKLKNAANGFMWLREVWRGSSGQEISTSQMRTRLGEELDFS